MSHKRFFMVLITLSVLMGVFYTASVKFSLQYELPWFDMMLHILGGILVSVIAFAFYLFSRRGLLPSRLSFLVVTLLAVSFVAVSWEFLELLFGLNRIPRGEYWPDTISDFGFGALGAVLGFFAISREYKLV